MQGQTLNRKGTVKMKADFSGYATKADLLCSDGRTIMSGAFKHQDKVKVPLVWQHGHTDPENVLGHVLLESREDGMYAHAFFNKTPKAVHMKEAVDHEDINFMSIWANDLIERSKKVIHGVIREVSLVLSGANPGAVIDSVRIRHSDGDEDILDGEVVITTGVEIVHGDSNLELTHADGDDDGDDNDSSKATIQDILDSMTDVQKDAVHYLVSEAITAANEADEDEDLQQGNTGESDDSDTVQHDNTDTDQEGSTMGHNVFEKDGKEGMPGNTSVLSHSQVETIFADAKAGKGHSLRETVMAYAEEHLEHGITNIETLFPEAQKLTQTPEWEKRDTGWVGAFLAAVSKRPFARIKSWTANITYQEARAKGYVTGNMKKDEWFSIHHRETTPQTIYKKQKLDRDDIIDITDFDVVAWMKVEMRMMLDEELARAVLVGDGREVTDEDKIKETNIRPIATDDPYYTIQVGVDLMVQDATIQDAIDQVIFSRQFFKGTGSPNFYTTEHFIALCLTLRDDLGRKIYKTVDEVAAEMRVRSIIPVEILNEYGNIIGIMVNPADYVIGADKGGKVTMFDDFDIDFNQEKYLIETRVSGALTKPKSAMVLKYEAGNTAVAPDAPTFDRSTSTVTVPTVVGVEYIDANGDVVAAGDVVLVPQETLILTAQPTTGNYFMGGHQTRWSFMGVETN